MMINNYVNQQTVNMTLASIHSLVVLKQIVRKFQNKYSRGQVLMMLLLGTIFGSRGQGFESWGAHSTKQQRI